LPDCALKVVMRRALNADDGKLVQREPRRKRTTKYRVIG
jgi:hypothetical protein